jgi:hypothetical protein
MAAYTFIYIVVGVLLVLIIILLLGTIGAGKPIQCPECKFKFKRPRFTQKSVGMGPSLPWIGSFICPHCQYRGRALTFKRVNDLNNDDIDQKTKDSN